MPKGSSATHGERRGERLDTAADVQARALRPRVLIYGAVLSAASVTFAASVAMRSPFKFDVVRTVARWPVWWRKARVENVYRIQIMNRTGLRRPTGLPPPGSTGWRSWQRRPAPARLP